MTMAQVDGFCISTSHADEIRRIPILLPTSWQNETVQIKSVNGISSATYSCLIP